MNCDDSKLLTALAERLDSTPRRVLAAAARMIEQADADPAACLAALRRAGTKPHDPADACANLLLTPVASYAVGSVEPALRALWKVSN